MQEIYDLVIIGSGPAGLSAAVYGMRAGLNLLVVERNPMSGGQVLNTYEVDNYLGMPGINGFDMGVKFREHADKLGAPFLEAEVTGLTEGEIKTVHTTEGDLRAKAVILATGAHHAQLEVPGEEALSGMGVSYCATCDGAFYRGKTVAVVGGGDVALEDAIYLTRFCGKVYLIHRRDELRGAHVLQEQLRALPGAEILYSHVVKEIQGQEAVTGVLLEDLKSGERRILSVDGVFVAVGIRPETELLKDLALCDEAGYVPAGEDGATGVPGIYVAGDIRRKPLRQVVTAVADGANAVTAAAAWIGSITV